jgi:hypothetical protein
VIFYINNLQKVHPMMGAHHTGRLLMKGNYGQGTGDYGNLNLAYEYGNRNIYGLMRSIIMV